jgi:hypothetical protein
VTLSREPIKASRESPSHADRPERSTGVPSQSVKNPSSRTGLRRATGRGQGSNPIEHSLDPTQRGDSSTSASISVYRVDFEKLRVSAKDRIGAAGSGWATWQEVMLDGCVLAAAQAAGGAQSALEITVEYAKTRQQFGNVLGAFQAISHYVADGATQIAGGSTLVYEAAWSRSVGADATGLMSDHRATAGASLAT